MDFVNATPTTPSTVADPGILQNIISLALKNNQQGQQQQQSGAGSGVNTQQQSGGDIQNSMSQIHALSQILGYDPQTMFGYNLGGSGVGSSPQGSGGMISALMSLFGS